jgi:hypothetical protein
MASPIITGLSHSPILTRLIVHAIRAALGLSNSPIAIGLSVSWALYSIEHPMAELLTTVMFTTLTSGDLAG